MEAFKIENLTFRYPDTETDVLKNIDLTIKQGDFICICGPSGCGKSTLMRNLKPSVAPHGNKSGKILFFGTLTDKLAQRDEAQKIGFVFQSPENQIVTDKVWHELAFGLESLGYDNSTIRRRVAETASFFGIQELFEKNVTELSGGQKQILNLASIMAMQSEVIILDEPTSQLDPIAASEFIGCLSKINREIGTTVIITEHRLDEIIPISTKVAVIENGSIAVFDTPENTCKKLLKQNSDVFLSMPAPIKIWAAVKMGESCPVTVAQGRNQLYNFSQSHMLNTLPVIKDENVSDKKAAVLLKDVWFRYEKDSMDVLKGLNLTAFSGEFTAILGGNGTGKSTALSVINEIHKPYRGKVITSSKSIATLPQNPQTLFVKKTVYEDLKEVFDSSKIPKEDKTRRLKQVISLCKLNDLLSRHPYDLSGGEQQRAALAKVLLLSPDILLLDEPTKGMDADFKKEFAKIIKSLTISGVSVIMVSHDVEFCAEYTDRCIMFFNGNAVTSATPRKFFACNSFYVTSANRMSRGIIENAVTCDDVIYSCTGIKNYYNKNNDFNKLNDLYNDNNFPKRTDIKQGSLKSKLPLWKKLLGSFSLALLIFGIIYNIYCNNFEDSSFWNNVFKYAVIAIPVILMIISFGQKSKKPIDEIRNPSDKRKISKRTITATIMILLAIPLTIFVGITYLQDQKYLFISLLVMLECMLPFFMIFEGRKPQTRELVVIAVMCALAVAGRLAFSFLPQFKPVVALVIISGVAFGGETGFIVGAVAMLASNIMLGQGIWTPWQMFAVGVIGFLGGILFKKGLLCRNRGALCTFGFIATIVIYGGIMNFYSAVTAHQALNSAMLFTFYITGFPMDLIHAISTAVFLYFGAEPIFEKTDRIKTKYSLIS